jgi:hypothetical protein
MQRTSKSIPFGGGMNEDAPQEIIEAPSVLLAKNVRFNKKDSCEKALPLKKFPSTSEQPALTSLTDTPSFIYGDSEFLISASEDTLSSYDRITETWREKSLPFELLGIDHILKSKPGPNASNYSWAPIGYSDDGFSNYQILGYCVGFDCPTFNTDEEPSTCIQLYSRYGDLLLERVYAGYCSPQIQPTYGTSGESELAGFHMVVRSTGSIIHGRAHISISGGYAITPEVSLDDSGVDTVRNAQYYNTSNKTYNNQYPEELRMGHARSWKDQIPQIRYSQKWNDSSGGCFVYKDDSTGFLSLQETNAYNGEATGSPIALTLIPDINDTYHPYVLDVECIGTYQYILFATHNAATATTNVYLKRRHRGTGALDTETLDTNNNAVIPRGTIAVESATRVHWAFQVVRDGGDTFGHSDYTDSIKWGKVQFGGSVTTSTVPIWHAGLVSNMVYSSYTDRAYVVVEQYANFTPGRYSSTGFGSDSPTITPTLSKATTATLLCLDIDNEEYYPTAAYDPAQSKTIDYSCSEQTIHLNNLYYFTGVEELDSEDAAYIGYHQFWYGNCQQITPEQNFVFVMQLSDENVSDYDHDYAKRALAPGSRRLNIYAVRQDGTINVAQVKHGCFISAALPLWYDGNTVVEECVLDQPEIVYVAKESGFVDVILWTSYNILDAETPIVIQAVVGFYDADGLMHRSAPSNPLYVADLGDEGDDITLIKVAVTTPISAQDPDGKYFVEIYTGLAGEEPQLTTTEPLSTQRSSSPGTTMVKFKFPDSSGGVGKFVTNIPLSSAFVYTNGDVLAADPWPAMKALTRTSTRLFGIMLNEPSIVVFSKLFEDGIAPEFNASLLISLGTGRVATAIGSIDDKVIIFEDDRINVLYGEGPDNTGANGYFSVEPVQSVVGCSSQNSVLSTPDGVMFFSETTSTFHLVTRDLQVVEIGKPVMDLTRGATVLSAVRDAAEHEAIFFMSDVGPEAEYGNAADESDVDRPPRTRFGYDLDYCALVYNYEYQKWSVRTGFTESTIWRKTAVYNGRPVGIDNNLDVWRISKETETDWRWAELQYIETPWIKLNQLQNYGGVLGITILGRYLSDWKENTAGYFESGDLQVTLKYDYEGPDGREDVYLWRANVDLNQAGRENLQVYCRPGRRKCQAIKIIVEEVATTKLESFEPSYSTGRGFQVLGVDIEYGLKSYGVKNGPKSRRK